MDLTIAPGETIGLVGPSGSGKSTVLDVIAGLLEPEGGLVTADAAPLDTIRLPEWRSRLAYVTQDTVLFDGDVRANLVWGSPATGDDALWTALAAAGLADLIRALPEGLATRTGERGFRFSGGQRQRLALARAILRRPSLLLLDEATSALDREAEAAILAELRQALPCASILLVSHRTEALMACDRVIALRNGRIETEAPA